MPVDFALKRRAGAKIHPAAKRQFHRINAPIAQGARARGVPSDYHTLFDTCFGKGDGEPHKKCFCTADLRTGHGL